MFRYRFYLRAIATLLLLVILGTSSGLALNVHYCKGHVKSLALFVKPTACYEKVANDVQGSTLAKGCKKENQPSVERTQCCVDDSYFCKLWTSYTIVKGNILPENAAYLDFSGFLTSSTRTNDAYHRIVTPLPDPPIPCSDVQVVYQVFRI